MSHIHIGGGVNTGGGDFIGHDKHVTAKQPVTIKALLSDRNDKMIRWEDELYELTVPSIAIAGLHLYMKVG